MARELSIDRMRAKSAQIASLKPPRIIRENGLVFDRETLLHLNHVKNGGIGYGVRVLPQAAMSVIDGVLEEEGFEFLRNRNCEFADLPSTNESEFSFASAPPFQEAPGRNSSPACSPGEPA